MLQPQLAVSLLYLMDEIISFFPTILLFSLSAPNLVVCDDVELIERMGDIGMFKFQLDGDRWIVSLSEFAYHPTTV